MSHSSKEQVEAQVSRVLTGSVITIKQARIEIGEISGHRPDKSTMIRWMTRGVDGVRLDGCKLGREWLTSTEALHRFIVERTKKSVVK